MNKSNLSKELISRKNSFFGRNSILPNPDRILQTSGKRISEYNKLKNDPHVWSCIQSRKSGVLSLKYIISNESSSIGKFISEVFSKLDTSQIIRDILEAPLYGFQPIEIIWEQKDNFLIPIKLEAKPQDSFFYDINGNLKIYTNGMSGIDIPEYKILNIRYEASFANPYGESLLSKCYWPIIFKSQSMRYWVNFSEKFGMPLLLGKYTRGATKDEAEKLAEELVNMAEDTVIVTPHDIEIDMKEPARNSSEHLYKEMIKLCNAEISKALLSQTLTTELDMGSYAASETHFKVRKEVVRSDANLVESAMNKLIEYICDLNFEVKELPKFKFIFNNSDDSMILERDIKLSQSGVIQFTKEYWMNNYGFKLGDIK